MQEPNTVQNPEDENNQAPVNPVRTEGTAERLMPSPYEPESAKRFTDISQAAQNVEEQSFAGMQQPAQSLAKAMEEGNLSQIDPRTRRQIDLLTKAKTYWTFDGKKKQFTNPAASYGEKYREMAIKGGSYLQDFDENGQAIAMDVQLPDGTVEKRVQYFPLNATREYEMMTNKRGKITEYMYPTMPEQVQRKQAPEGIAGTVGAIAGEAVDTAGTILGKAPDYIRSTLIDRTGYGDLAEADEALKALGITNVNARAVALRAMAANEDTWARMSQYGKDIFAMGLGLPEWARKGLAFTQGKVLQGAASVVTSIVDDEKTKVAVQNFADSFERATDKGEGSFDLAKQLNMQTLTAERSGEIYRPEYIEAIMMPRSGLEFSVGYAIPEAMTYGPMLAIKVLRAQKQMGHFEKWLKNNYGGEDYASSLLNATKEVVKDGKTVSEKMPIAEVMLEYRKSIGGKALREKSMKRLDTALQLKARKPGAARDLLLEDEIKDIDDQIVEANNLIQAAEKTNSTTILGEQKRRLDDLTKQKEMLADKALTPKFLRDARKEMGHSVGFTTLFSTYAEEFMQVQSQTDLIGPEVAGALLVAFGDKKFGAYSLSRGFGTFASTNVSRVTAAYKGAKAKIGGGSFQDVYGEIMSSKTMDADTRAFFKDLSQREPEFQNVILTGLSKNGMMQNFLVELSAATDIPLDKDMLISNIATMSQVADLTNAANQLNTKIVVTGLEDLSGPIVERMAIATRQQELVSGLAAAADRVMQAAQKANLPDDHPVIAMATDMRGFAVNQGKRLQEERQFLIDWRNNNLAVFEGLATEQILRGGNAEDSLGMLEYFDSAFNAFIDDAASPLSSVSKDLRGEVVGKQGLIEPIIDRANEAAQLNHKLLQRIARTVRVANAQKGGASQVVAFRSSLNRAVWNNESNRLYRAFDKVDAHSDVGDLAEDLLLGGYNLDDAANPEVINKAAGLFKKGILPKTSRGTSMLLNESAKMSEDYFNTILYRSNQEDGPDQLNILWQNLDLQGAQPIERWAQIRQWAKNPEAALKRIEKPEGMTDEQHAELVGKVQDMIESYAEAPLLVNAAEWRSVKSHLSENIRVANKSKAEGMVSREREYLALMDRWKMSLDDKNPAAFHRGWLNTDLNVMPENVAAGVKKQLDEADEYYIRNVVNRRSSKTLQRQDRVLPRTMERSTVDEETGEVVMTQEEFLQSARGVNVDDPKNAPINWLNDIVNDLRSVTSKNGVLDGEMRYENIDKIFGSMGGMWDPKTNRYVLVIDSADEGDQIITEGAQEMAAMIERHLQGILDRDINGTMFPTNLRGDVTYDPLADIPYDKDLLETLFNIPVYRKTETGEYVLIEGKKFIDEEKVWGVTSLEELEHRADAKILPGADPKLVAKQQQHLRDVIDEGREVVNDLADDLEQTPVINYRGEPRTYFEAIEDERQFIQDLRARWFGTTSDTVDQAVPDEDVVKGVFSRLIEQENGLEELDRLTNVMVDAGYSRAGVENFVNRAISQHMVNVTQAPTGKLQSMGKDFKYLEIPEAGISAEAIRKVIGTPGTSRYARLSQIMGQDKIETWGKIADTLDLITPKRVGQGDVMDVSVSSMSLDSILSRIYNIQRGVVSVQWVATESIIRGGRQHKGKLLMAMLNDPEFAGKVLDIVRTGRVPEDMARPEAWRPLLAETIYQENVNDFISNMTEGVRAGFESVTGESEYGRAVRESEAQRAQQAQEVGIGMKRNTGLLGSGKQTKLGEALAPKPQEEPLLAEDAQRMITEVEKDLRASGYSDRVITLLRDSAIAKAKEAAKRDAAP
jgi:hypothetical protein